MASPTSADFFDFNSPRLISTEKSYDPVQMQVELLREFAAQGNTSTKEMQSHYQSTIMFCINSEKGGQAIELLNEIETKNIYEDAPEAKAKLFSSVIDKLISKGLHANADEVFKASDAKGVWKNFPTERSTTVGQLGQVGFKY